MGSLTHNVHCKTPEGWQRGAGIFMAPDINHRDAERECFRKEDLKQRPECNFVCLTGGGLLFVSLYFYMMFEKKNVYYISLTKKWLGNA